MGIVCQISQTQTPLKFSTVICKILYTNHFVWIFCLIQKKVYIWFTCYFKLKKIFIDFRKRIKIHIFKRNIPFLFSIFIFLGSLLYRSIIRIIVPAFFLTHKYRRMIDNRIFLFISFKLVKCLLSNPPHGSRNRDIP